MNHEDLKPLLILSALGVSGRHWDAILSKGGPKKILENHQSEVVKMISSPISKDQLDFGFWEEVFQKAEKKADQIQFFLSSGGALLGLKGPREMGRLLRAPSPPLCAYVRGSADVIYSKPTVAIIGTRKPSAVGLQRAFDVAVKLTKGGCLVVSGGALGIDYAAHQGALSAKGKTLVVLGNSVQVRQDERPFRILELRPMADVTTLTVFGPWVPNTKALFVSRNQYVAALADAVLIIEGTMNSGTLHTARYAKQMGVPVWAIPGDVDNPLAGAANHLLYKQEARAFLKVEDLLKSFGFSQSVSVKTEFEGEHSDLVRFFMANEGRLTLDALCEGLRKPVSELCLDLLDLELAGTLKKEGTEFVLTMS